MLGAAVAERLDAVRNAALRQQSEAHVEAKPMLLSASSATKRRVRA
jgi:hypothetical protein